MAMRAKYIGETFYVDGLTANQIYEVVGYEGGLLRVIDDSGEDYLYSATNPGPYDGSVPNGRWEVVEDEDGKLEKWVK